MPAKSPEKYSTNPNTIKVRERRANLEGIQKVEAAAKIADYKAMNYARKILESKPEFAAATEAQKKELIKTAMKESMDKRRAKGQDTLSKLAAYKAGDLQVAAGTKGPRTRVPISSFLQDGGYIPLPASQAARAVNGEAVSENGIDDSYSPTPNALMSGTEDGSAPAEFPVDAPPHRGLASLGSSKSAHEKNQPRIKTSGSPATEAPAEPMDPEADIMPSIERDDNTEDAVEALRQDVDEIRNMCYELHTANQRQQNLELLRGGNVRDNRVDDLNRRTSQLEGLLSAVQNTAIPQIADRVNQLENMIVELQERVGNGCEAEVANMREVFGSLREGLQSLGGFL